MNSRGEVVCLLTSNLYLIEVPFLHPCIIDGQGWCSEEEAGHMIESLIALIAVYPGRPRTAVLTAAFRRHNWLLDSPGELSISRSRPSVAHSFPNILFLSVQLYHVDQLLLLLVIAYINTHHTLDALITTRRSPA